MLHWEIEYYRDIWEDDNTRKRAVYDQEPGQIIYVQRMVSRFAYNNVSWAVVHCNGSQVTTYKRDAETGKWREYC